MGVPHSLGNLAWVPNLGGGGGGAKSPVTPGVLHTSALAFM